MNNKDILVIAESRVKEMDFKKHFIKINKVKKQAGLTIEIILTVSINIADVQLNEFEIKTSFMPTADEFNNLRKAGCIYP